MIKSYFARIKALVDKYTITPFVLDTSVNFETRPGEQGYLAGLVTFVDNSALHFSEYLDADKYAVDKVMYTYHYQDKEHQLIFRYDNARHHPPMQFLEHKHKANQIVGAPSPSLEDVLFEILMTRGWI